MKPPPVDRAAQRKAWGPYVRHVADLLWLRDWTLTVSPDDPDDEETRAMIYPARSRRHATLAFAESFLDDDDEPAQRQTVVHELIHLHLQPSLVIVETAIEGDLRSHHRMMFEYGIDAIADAFAVGCPLPSTFNTEPKGETNGQE
jgi:hypothetical protein